MLLGLGGWFLGSALASQLDQLGRSLAESWMHLQSGLQKYDWGRQLLAGLPSVQSLANGQGIARVTNLFSTSVGGSV
jgi:hypothetical protein